MWQNCTSLLKGALHMPTENTRAGEFCVISPKLNKVYDQDMNWLAWMWKYVPENLFDRMVNQLNLFTFRTNWSATNDVPTYTLLNAVDDLNFCTERAREREVSKFL